MCAYQQPVDQGRTNSIKNKSGAIRTDKTVWSHGCSSFISEAVPASFEVQAWDCCDAPPLAPTILVAVVAVVAVVAWKRNIYAVRLFYLCGHHDSRIFELVYDHSIPNMSSMT